MNDNLCRNGVGKTEIIGGGHAIDQHANLVPACDGLDNRARVGCAFLRSQAVDARSVVQSAVDPAEASRFHHALKGLVDCISACKIEKVPRRPDGIFGSPCDTAEDL